jgi:hypothetical protein
VINIEEIKKEVIYSDNESRLFELMVELNQEISRNHVELAKTDEIVRKAELRGEISVLNSMLTIIDKRIDEVKLNSAENGRKEFYLNRQFRIAAEYILKRETFERIKELSLINYIKLKENKAELRNNKLE